jgi:hypothetical protein
VSSSISRFSHLLRHEPSRTAEKPSASDRYDDPRLAFQQLAAADETDKSWPKTEDQSHESRRLYFLRQREYSTLISDVNRVVGVHPQRQPIFVHNAAIVVGFSHEFRSPARPIPSGMPDVIGIFELSAWNASPYSRASA